VSKVNVTNRTQAAIYRKLCKIAQAVRVHSILRKNRDTVSPTCIDPLACRECSGN
jgi:hypothetical protein